MLALGEIHTCLLHNSTALPRLSVEQLLGLVPGERVRSQDRPVNHAVSPNLSTGIDCRLATTTGAKVRGIGTVGSHVVVTGGTVIQSSTLTHVRAATSADRLDWSYYAGRPHSIDAIGQVEFADLGAGFLADDNPASTLDLGAVSARLVTMIQKKPLLDHVTALRARSTRVRWAAWLGATKTAVAKVHTRNNVIRTVELTVRDDEFDLVAAFCEDFALHDWLLTALDQLIETAERAKTFGEEPIDVIGPAVERLLHLWMPGVHVHPALAILWESLERRPGYSLQWNAHVARIRDQIALHTLQELQKARNKSASW